MQDWAGYRAERLDDGWRLGQPIIGRVVGAGGRDARRSYCPRRKRIMLPKKEPDDDLGTDEDGRFVGAPR